MRKNKNIKYEGWEREEQTVKMFKCENIKKKETHYFGC